VVERLALVQTIVLPTPNPKKEKFTSLISFYPASDPLEQ
jgi:hypothetical protein